MATANLVPETALVPHHPGLAEVLASGAPGPKAGGWQEIEPQGQRGGLMTGPVYLVHLRNALWSPRTGLIAMADGPVPDAPAQQVRRRDTALSALHAATPQRITRGAVWVSGGSGSNYGHFLMDSLTGLSALQSLGITAGFTPFSPALTPWQRGLAATASLQDQVQEIRAKAVHFDELVYVTTLGHYLQRSGSVLADLLARIQPRRPALAPDGPVIYLSRRRFTGRILVNEPALETALAARGVHILHPERLTPAEQIRHCAAARMLIGASGAGLANMCFLPEGAAVVELRPQNVQEQWLDLAASLRGLNHICIPGSAALPRAGVPLAVKLRQMPRWLARRYHFAWRVDIAAVLASLDTPPTQP